MAGFNSTREPCINCYQHGPFFGEYETEFHYIARYIETGEGRTRGMMGTCLWLLRLFRNMYDICVLCSIWFYAPAGHSVVSAEGFVEHMRTASGAGHVVCMHALSVAVTPGGGNEGSGQEKIFFAAQPSGSNDGSRQGKQSRVAQLRQNDRGAPDCKSDHLNHVSIVERGIKEDTQGTSLSIAAPAPPGTGMICAYGKNIPRKDVIRIMMCIDFSSYINLLTQFYGHAHPCLSTHTPCSHSPCPYF